MGHHHKRVLKTSVSVVVVQQNHQKDHLILALMSPTMQTALQVLWQETVLKVLSLGQLNHITIERENNSKLALC